MQRPFNTGSVRDVEDGAPAAGVRGGGLNQGKAFDLARRLPDDDTVEPAATVMSAYLRRRGEDRVTELLATVLARSAALMDRLVMRVGLERASGYDVRTQVTSGGITIDLEIAARANDGAARWVLWSEHKVEDPLTVRQLRDEWDALGTRAGPRPAKLIAITRYAPSPEVTAFADTIACTLLRWTDVNLLALSVRRAHAAGGGEPSSVDELFVAEWLSFASYELEAAVEPLSPQRIRYLPEAEKTLDTIEHLMTAGFTRACAEISAGVPRERDEELHAAPPEGSWLAERGFMLYAKYASDGFGPLDEPCLVVGGWVEGDDAISARRSRELHTVLTARGLALWDEEDRRGGWIEFGAPVALSALGARSTLKEQDEAFGDAAIQALTALACEPS